ncbi:MAG: hypothetical protein PSY14_00420 [bacterium]|nr:hypothetical protein [bacterium]
MTFFRLGLPAAFAILLTVIETTPAQAHGGVELVILAGFIGAILLALGCILGVLITYFIIYKLSRRSSKKSGKPPTSKISIAILSPIVFFVFTVIAVRVLTYGPITEMREMDAQAERERIEKIGKPHILTQDEEAKLKRLFEAAERNSSDSGELAEMYLHGNGAVQDFVESYFWLSVYMQQVLPAFRESEVEIAKLNSFKNRITPEQAAAVDLRVAEWLRKHPPLRP